jgi:hypothetical protein
MPSKTLDFHRQVANGGGGNVRMAMETVAEIMKYREAIFRAAPSHQGGHSATGAAIADALDCTFPLRMEELEAKARDDKMDPDVLWPWLRRMRVPVGTSHE